MAQLNLDAEWNFYYPKVYGYFFRRLENRSDVEDLTSVVLQQFFEILLDEEKSQRVENKLAYLWKIAHNHLVNFINTKTKKPLPIGLEDNMDSVNPNFEKIESQYLQERLKSLMHCLKEQLKESDYQVVVLSIIEDKKSQEVGEVLNITPENVRKKLSRSLSKLREKCREVWHQ